MVKQVAYGVEVASQVNTCCFVWREEVGEWRRITGKGQAEVVKTSYFKVILKY